MQAFFFETPQYYMADSKLLLCLNASGKSFTKGFALAFGLRALIGVLSRAVVLARKKPVGLFSFSSVLGEKHVVFRVEAIRLGLFVGSFSGIYHALCLLFAYLQSKREKTEFNPQLNYKEKPKDDQRTRIETYFAGAIAGGVSVSFLSHDNRRTLALYSMARAFQSIFYSKEYQGVWKSMLPIIPLPFSLSLDVHKVLQKHLDAILFIISSAQIMYSYVMCPHTLPSSYWNFIVRTGPIPAKILEAARHVAGRDYPIPLEKLGLLLIFFSY